MATTKRVEIKTFNGNRDFSLWKIRIQAQLGVLGLKNSLTDFSLTKTVPLTKSEGKKPVTEDDGSEGTQTKEVSDLIKIEQSEQAKNIIINHSI
ncbi:unnamed protein product [Arabidopsis halleri]